MHGSTMQIKQRPGATGVNARGRTRLNVVAKQYTGPPPAWNKRVVVPDVQPRDGPKVRIAVGTVPLALQMPNRCSALQCMRRPMRIPGSNCFMLRAWLKMGIFRTS